MAHIKFTEIPVSGKKGRIRLNVESVYSGAHLGVIEWRSCWRCWVFSPADNTIFSADCLGEISRKLIELGVDKTL